MAVAMEAASKLLMTNGTIKEPDLTEKPGPPAGDPPTLPPVSPPRPNPGPGPEPEPPIPPPHPNPAPPPIRESIPS